MDPAAWKPALKRFFSTRAMAVKGVPSMEDLCFISGKDPRIWQVEDNYSDMIGSVLRECGVGPRSKILEVGCAAGFLALGLAPRVREYVGVDLASAPLHVARRLGLTNARFRRADGARLPFADNSFDAGVCYDVFSNFPAFSCGLPIIREMIRVVCAGGRVLVGSLTDAGREEEFIQYVSLVAKELEQQYGPMPTRQSGEHATWILRLRQVLGIREVEGRAVSHYFHPSDFLDAAEELGATARIASIHAKNPYADYRFNVIYLKNTS